MSESELGEQLAELRGRGYHLICTADLVVMSGDEHIGHDCACDYIDLQEIQAALDRLNEGAK